MGRRGTEGGREGRKEGEGGEGGKRGSEKRVGRIEGEKVNSARREKKSERKKGGMTGERK